MTRLDEIRIKLEDASGRMNETEIAAYQSSLYLEAGKELIGIDIQDALDTNTITGTDFQVRVAIATSLLALNVEDLSQQLTDALHRISALEDKHSGSAGDEGRSS